jgi:hypothetical protein
VQDWDFEAGSTCNLNITVTTTSGLTMDSQGATDFVWDGKVVYNVASPNGNTATNPSCVVLLNPQTNTADGFAGIYAGRIRIKSLIAIPSGGATTTGIVCANTAIGSVIQQTLDFQEVNANNVAYKGVMTFGASATTGFQQNHVYINQIHGAVSKGLDVGFGATNQTLNNSNQWVVNNIENNGASSRGIDTWASYDTYDIGVINNAQGGLQYGIVTENGAASNQFRYGQIASASSAALLDGGTASTFIAGGSATLPALTMTGLLRSTYGTPTIASGACGTGANGTIAGTNQSGVVTIGSAATTTCTISFSATLAAAPNACVIFPENAGGAAQGTTVARVGAPSTSAWAITGSALASTAYSYICL